MDPASNNLPAFYFETERCGFVQTTKMSDEITFASLEPIGRVNTEEDGIDIMTPCWLYQVAKCPKGLGGLGRSGC